MSRREEIRNIAIIAHVDHGKTTLVDAMLRQAGAFGRHQKMAERILDSGDLERERGITILAKNTAVRYEGLKINIVDTPGHADFGGEVERVLGLVDGCLLVVDAAEGPLPQTRYVLRKALERRLPPVVVINKLDRVDARPVEVLDEILDLFIDLGADENQVEFPVVYATGRLGQATLDPAFPGENLVPLFETIRRFIPPPEAAEGPLQLQVAATIADDYQGRLGVGRLLQGHLAPGQTVAWVHEAGTDKARIGRVYIFEGLGREEVTEVAAGEIVAVAGLPEVGLGDTITDPDDPQPLPRLHLDEPTLRMTFKINDSPFVGREGQYVTSRHLRERLWRELERDLSLKVEETDSPDAFLVSGRGELHLGILIETMRREGYELAVSKPEVIIREVDGERQEPYEYLVLDLPSEYLGTAMELLGSRRAELLNMTDSGGNLRLEMEIPARGLLGFRSIYLTETKGYGSMSHLFARYGPYRGDIAGRQRGSLIASEPGQATTYALHHLGDRGTFFIGPGTQVYAGMVVGEYTRESDIELNVTKRKHVTNVRSATAEETLRLTPPHILSLEEALEFLAEDELLEVTPNGLRLRKAILDPGLRQRKAKERSRG